MTTTAKFLKAGKVIQTETDVPILSVGTTIPNPQFQPPAGQPQNRLRIVSAHVDPETGNAEYVVVQG